MKTWLMELCPEIAEWQAEAIEEYHKSAVKLAREAVVQELVAGSGEPVIAREADAVSSDEYYTADQLAGAVLRERERVIQILDGIDRDDLDEPEGWWETSRGKSFGTRKLAAIRGQT